jgi:hypothetical protein
MTSSPPKGRDGGQERRDGTKAKPKSSRTNTKPYSSTSGIWSIMCALAGLGSPAPWGGHLQPIWLLFWTGSTTFPVAFLGGCSTFLVSLASWGIHCRLGITLTDSCRALSGAALKDLHPVTHCLASQAFLCHQGGSFHSPINLSFFLLSKPALHG